MFEGFIKPNFNTEMALALFGTVTTNNYNYNAPVFHIHVRDEETAVEVAKELQPPDVVPPESHLTAEPEGHKIEEADVIHNS